MTPASSAGTLLGPFPTSSHHSRELKVGRLLPCPGIRLRGGVMGCFVNAWGAMSAPLTISSTLSVNFKAMQGEGDGEHWPELQRSGATPTSLSSALTSPFRQWDGQGRLEEYVQGGSSWHTTFRVWSKVLTGNHAPGQERSLCSHDFCLMLFLFLPLIFPAAAWDPSSIRLFVVATGKHPQTPKPCLFGEG